MEARATRSARRNGHRCEDRAFLAQMSCHRDRCSITSVTAPITKRPSVRHRWDGKRSVEVGACGFYTQEPIFHIRHLLRQVLYQAIHLLHLCRLVTVAGAFLLTAGRRVASARIICSPRAVCRSRCASSPRRCRARAPRSHEDFRISAPLARNVGAALRTQPAQSPPGMPAQGEEAEAGENTPEAPRANRAPRSTATKRLLDRRQRRGQER